MKTLLAIAVLLSSFSALAQPGYRLSLNNPPDGYVLEAWQDAWKRSQRVGELAAKTVRGANKDCIAAVALDILACADVTSSMEGRRKPAEQIEETVKDKKGSSVKRTVRKHREDSCRGPGGDGPPGSATSTDLEALLRFTSNQSEWQTTDYDTWKRTADAIRAAFAAGLGVGANVAESAAGVLPIVNPCAVAPRLSICAEKQAQSL